MDRARRHQRLLSILAFGLLALVAELAGRSLTHRIDLGRHVRSPSYSGTDYYPILVGAVKVGIALLLARLAWRLIRAHAAERAARRLLSALGTRPRLHIRLSARLWLAVFVSTSLFYLVQADAEGLAEGRWPVLGPWLHSSALPVFAVLAVLVAVAWGAVQRWLADYEQFTREAVERARRVRVRAVAPVLRPQRADAAPRRLFGLAFESRPPPALA